MSPRTRSSRGGGSSRASPSRSPSRRSPSPSAKKRHSASKSPSTSARRAKKVSKTTSPSPKRKTGGGAASGNNWVDGGLGDGTLMVPFLLVFAPMFVQVLAYLTSADCAVDPTVGLSGLLSHCSSDLGGCATSIVDVVRASYAAPTWEAVKFLLGFGGLALALDVGLPGTFGLGRPSPSARRRLTDGSPTLAPLVMLY